MSRILNSQSWGLMNLSANYLTCTDEKLSRELCPGGQKPLYGHMFSPPPKGISVYCHRMTSSDRVGCVIWAGEVRMAVPFSSFPREGFLYYCYQTDQKS